MEPNSKYPRNTAGQSVFYPVQAVSRSVIRRSRRRILGGMLLAVLAGGIYTSLPPVNFPPPAQVADNTSDTVEIFAGLEPASSEKPSLVEIPAVLTPPAPAPKTYPLAIDLTVRDGDTLLSLLTDVGASTTDAHNAVASLRTIYNPRHLDIGQNIAVTLDEPPAEEAAPVISGLSMAISPTTSVEMKRKENKGFVIKKIEAPVETRLSHVGGIITSSLYQDGIKNGIPRGMLGQIIKAYSYDVDFQRDIHPGDSIDVLYERIQTKDGGVRVGVGKMIHAQLKLGKRVLKIYRFTDKDGTSGYYNEKGENVKKALLRTPIDGAHITSGFGLRMHPILGYSKMHRGVDFGARAGTPVYAAGDGIIEYMGVKGGYGNYVRLNHSQGYASAYAHLSRFAKGMSRGKKVKQGQIIAYVGSTGRSTGPHLHYEILANNKQVNPAGVKFKGGWPLTGKTLASFKANQKKIEATYAALARGETEVASASPAPKKIASKN